MASNPLPFPVEENTDEDFFDKLVNDEDDVDFSGTTSHGPHFLDGNESYETKTFSNLNVNEFDSNCDVSFDHASYSFGNNASNLDTEIRTVEHIHDACEVEDSRNSIALSNSTECNSSVCVPKKEDEIAEISSDATFVSKSSGGSISDTNVVSQNSIGSGVPGVKEMDWSAFHSDSNKNDDNSTVTYSDFFSELGGDSAGDAWGNVGDGLDNGSKALVASEVHGSTYTDNSYYELYNNVDNGNYEQYNGGNNYNLTANQTTDVQDLNSRQYWESMYPGWKYDSASGQWYQIDNNDNSGASEQENVDSNLSSTWGMTGEKTEVSYLQQTAQSVTGTVAESGRIESVTDWNQTSQESDATAANVANWNQVIQASSVIPNQASQDSSNYPPHMAFDPQYPGWYYDTIAQEWYSLESYMASTQSTTEVQDLNQDGYALRNTYTQNNDQQPYRTQGQDNNLMDQTPVSQIQNQNWTGPLSNYNQQGSQMWQPEAISVVESTSQYGGIPQMNIHHGKNFSISSQGRQQNSDHYGAAGSFYNNVSQGQNEFYMPSSSQGLSVVGNLSQQFNNLSINQHDQKIVPNEYYRNQNSANFSQQQIQATSQISYTPAAGRASAGHPPHALVSFGFGGKLILMKDNSFTESLDFGSPNLVGGSISVLDLAEVVNVNSTPNYGRSSCIYFNSLNRQASPGPLTGGNVGMKELNKWIDERISNTESAVMDYQKAEGFKLLLSLLKMGCQYYGKFRSPYGTDTALKENDGPESAVAKLFSSGKRNYMQFSQYGAVAQCLQQMPSDRQIQVTADEVQNLLVSGRKKEALQHAQEGQLWGPALVLAAQLGNQFYVETVKQMALRQLVAGTPLRTLCLLIAGQPADVFSADNTATSNMAGAAKLPQQLPQFGANCLLDNWKENLAVITANRTKDDELVLIHLGDCLWKERSDVIAAHICYLVAEANFEPYSDSGSARLCLVGADHLKFPRTYASPEAIQRTELYEYSKTLGNSQFALLPFQPYKFVYANMLAEVGRISDSLKYCQVVLKSLKTGRSPEAEMLRQLVSSLEERIKIHQEGGFSANLAPKKLVGKLLNLFDSTAHRVVGGLPPTVPAAGGMNSHQSLGPRVATSQSTMAMSSLVPSQSTEPISEWTADNNKMLLHARSASEPDFGRSPRQTLKEASSTGEQDKGPAVGRRSRFGSFGFGSQLLQKTVGLVLSSRQGRQAKLGDTNKFYYDDKLKRWVEEGSAQPAEEEVLPPPPTTAVLQNGTSDYNLKNALQNEISHANRSPEYGSPSPLDSNSGIPPLPPTSNQYSARGRMGVRSRYVDTFNQGGGNSVNLFQSPSGPSIKPPASGPNPKFFVPTSVSSVDQPIDTHVNNMQDNSTHEYPSTSSLNDSFQTPTHPSSVNMQRFGSMVNLSKNSMHDNGSFSASSRRTASWSGSLNNSFHPSHKSDVKPLGEILGRHPSPLKPNDPSLAYSSNGGSFGDELHEVEL